LGSEEYWEEEEINEEQKRRVGWDKIRRWIRRRLGRGEEKDGNIGKDDWEG